MTKESTETFVRDVRIEHISYNDIEKDDWLKYQDDFGLASFINSNIRRTFMSNPNNRDRSKTAILLAIDNDVVVGRHLLYGTIIKSGSERIPAQSSGSTEVHTSQRGKGIGTAINMYTLNNQEYPVYICSLVTPAYLSIISKKENNCIIFDFQEFVKIVNVKSAFECRGLKGVSLRVCTWFGNLYIKVKNMHNKKHILQLKTKYDIREELVVPEWAADMCLNDGHQFAEVHDREWLQWNLTHNLSGKAEDKQHFWAIYRDGLPVGFIFTKERLRDDVTSNTICGTLCEWATIDSELKEDDINLLAVDTFPDTCYYVRTVTDDSHVAKQLLQMGYRHHGSMQMGIKDKYNRYPEMKNRELWRLRFGCCNSILY